MPDTIVHLRKQAAVLREAAAITEEAGDVKTALALQQLAKEKAKQADDLAAPHQWTGTHHGDTAGP
jgi:hypothetical protein